MAVDKKADTLAALSRDVVSQDKLLQRQLKSLVSESLELALYTMKHGSSADRMALMKYLTPHMLEALRTSQNTAEDEEKRRAYEEIRSMCRGEVAP